LDQEALTRIRDGQDLTMEEMAALVDSIMEGGWTDDEIVLLLESLREKGETVEEVAGAAESLRKHMTPVRSNREDLIDTCGTGGDASGTFNISTAAALVTAAAGVPVAKHGNRSITSRTGSADVLGELGVNIAAPVSIVERCLDELGIGFCFAPLLHPSMRHVAAARKRVGKPTIFNLLGPLCNPASAPYQLLGVGKPRLHPLLAAALAKLGIRHAAVVCGEDGLDEVTSQGTTYVLEIQDQQMTPLEWRPSDFGLPSSDRQQMLVDGPAASARMIRQILAGEKGPPREIVILNAAAALWTAGVDASPKNCAAQCAAAIDSGASARLLARLAELSHSEP
jgi:anthranilate phosphoribosyltransferase